MTDGALNGLDLQALAETVKAFSDDPSLAMFTFRVCNRWTGGMTCRSDVDDYFGICEERGRGVPFRLPCDLPTAVFGTDEAPTPCEYLLHALAGCTTMSLILLATMRGTAIHAVDAKISGRIDLLGRFGSEEGDGGKFENIDIEVTIAGEAPAEELEELCLVACRRSAIAELVAGNVPITVTCRVDPDRRTSDRSAQGAAG